MGELSQCQLFVIKGAYAEQAVNLVIQVTLVLPSSSIAELCVRGATHTNCHWHCMKKQDMCKPCTHCVDSTVDTGDTAVFGSHPIKGASTTEKHCK